MRRHRRREKEREEKLEKILRIKLRNYKL